jgi:hypothetical protein
MVKKPESSVSLKEPLLATMVYLKEVFKFVWKAMCTNEYPSAKRGEISLFLFLNPKSLS